MWPLSAPTVTSRQTWKTITVWKSLEGTRSPGSYAHGLLAAAEAGTAMVNTEASQTVSSVGAEFATCQEVKGQVQKGWVVEGLVLWKWQNATENLLALLLSSMPVGIMQSKPGTRPIVFEVQDSNVSLWKIHLSEAGFIISESSWAHIILSVISFHTTNEWQAFWSKKSLSTNLQWRHKNKLQMKQSLSQWTLHTAQNVRPWPHWKRCLPLS